MGVGGPAPDGFARPHLPPRRIALHAARVGAGIKHGGFLAGGGEAAFGPVFAEFGQVAAGG